MTLTINTVEDEQRQLKVAVEVAEDRVQKRMRGVAKRLGRELRIPGFRRGKVPYHVVVGRFGTEAIRAEAVEELVEPVFKEALDKIEFEPYAQASLDKIEVEGQLKLEFTLPLRPQVTLGVYRDTRKEIEAVTIEDEAVDAAITQIQERHAVLEPVERPIEAGDIVTLKGRAVGDDEAETVVFDEERIDFQMDGEKVYYGQALVDELIGLSANEEKSFTIAMPEVEPVEAEEAEEEAEEAEEAEGEDAAESEEAESEEAEAEDTLPTNATFEVTILDVKRRELPELDDELAQAEGEFETFEALKSSITENLQTQAEDEAKSQHIESLIDELLEEAEMVYPPAALDLELDNMKASFQQQITQSGWQWDDYLRLTNQTEEDLRSEWAEQAETRLKRGLALSQFIEDEKLVVSQAEFEAGVEKRLEMFDNDDTKQYMREFLMSDGGRSMIDNEVLMDKLYLRVEAIWAGTAPDLDALEAADEEE